MKRSLLATFLAAPLAVAGFLLFARKPVAKPEPAARAFYYWKTRWKQTPEQARSFQELGVEKLYLRFFDVDTPVTAREPRPVGVLGIDDPLPAGVEVVPVVFLRNRVFQDLKHTDGEKLAERVARQIWLMARDAGIVPREVQMDCDWTETTREAYFRFLGALKPALAASGATTLSTTIRLHQVKYREITGIPPVDRGVLMFYNMGKISAEAGRSSIYNAHDASRYLARLKTYPLTLDLALPLFSWAVHSRGSHLETLIEDIDRTTLDKNDGFERLADGRFRALRPQWLRGHYFREGDTLKFEGSDARQSLEAARLVVKSWNPSRPPASVVVFDWNEQTLARHTLQEISDVFDSAHAR
jgi:hypothetical protein